MSWTKRQFVLEAFNQIGYASYAYDLSPEQLQTGMYRLDSMLANWNGRGIRLGYPLPTNPQGSDLDDDSCIPDYANEAVYTNLALRVAPTIGLVVSVDTRFCARNSYCEMINKISTPCEMNYSHTLPIGQGNKPWRFDQPYFSKPINTVAAGQDGSIKFLENVKNVTNTNS
jgi:hypothetical protein